MKTGGLKSGRKGSGDGQPELFASLRSAPETRPSTRTARAGAEEAVVPEGREAAFEALLAHCAPVRAGGREAAWLKARHVFRKTWLAQGLRAVSDYRGATNGLLARFAPEALAAWGLFNREGHLRFYRHTLLVPWRDGDGVHRLQAFATEADAKPPVLSTAGAVPAPYNASRLDGKPGRLYLCAGALPTLQLLDAGFPAAGADDDGSLRDAWLPRFREKSVYVAYGSDADGEAAAGRALARLTAAGIEAHRLRLPGHAGAR